MLLFFCVGLISLISVSAEQVPCNNDQLTCRDSRNPTWVNDRVYCCSDEFAIELGQSVVNGSRRTMCACHRIYTERDCLVGLSNCMGASSLSSTNGLVQCCGNGEAMSSANSFINGVAVDYCKCRKYSDTRRRGGAAFGNSAVMTPNGVRPMTSQEQLQMQASFANMERMFQQSMNSLMGGLNSMFSGPFGGFFSGWNGLMSGWKGLMGGLNQQSLGQRVRNAFGQRSTQGQRLPQGAFSSFVNNNIMSAFSPRSRNRMNNGNNNNNPSASAPTEQSPPFPPADVNGDVVISNDVANANVPVTSQPVMETAQQQSQDIPPTLNP